MLWDLIKSILSSPDSTALATATTFAQVVFPVCRFLFSILRRGTKATWITVGRFILIVVMLLSAVPLAVFLSHVVASLPLLLLISNGWLLLLLPEFFKLRRGSRFLSLEILGHLLFLFLSANLGSYVLLIGYHGNAFVPAFIVTGVIELLLWSQNIQYKKIVKEREELDIILHSRVDKQLPGKREDRQFLSPKTMNFKDVDDFRSN